MTSSISQQELDMHFEKVEKELYEQEVTEQIVYFRFGQDNPLLTWTGLYKPHQS